MQLLRHVEVRALEHPLGDPEGDPVHEVALPELERDRRRLREAREVGQVPAERVPALRVGLGVGPAPPPQSDRERGCAGDACVHERADAEREQHDRLPRRRDARPAPLAHREEDPAEHAEDHDRADERDQPRVREPVAVPDLRADRLLEVLEPLRVRRAVVLDPVAELREPLGTVGEDVVDDVRDLGLVRRQRRAPCPARARGLRSPRGAARPRRCARSLRPRICSARAGSGRRGSP